MKDKKYLSQEKYDKANTVRVTLKLNLNTDKDILENIDMENKQASIKKLIRKALYN